MSAVAAPADRRFRRAHVKPSRKRGRWRALGARAAVAAALFAVCGYGLYSGREALAHAPMLKVDRIVVRGNDRLSKGEVLGVLSGMRGQNILWTNLDEWQRRLLAMPWVRDAALHRSLPSTVEVTIAERQPVGIGRINGDMYLVDERGIVIDQFGPQYADLDLPIIDGLASASPADNTMTDAARAELASRLIASLRPRPDIAKKVSQLNVSDVHNASVILSGDPATIYVGDDRFLPRLQSYLELASALRDRVPDIDYVDLRFDERIYLRPVGKGGRTHSVQPEPRVARPRRR